MHRWRFPDQLSAFLVDTHPSKGDNLLTFSYAQNYKTINGIKQPAVIHVTMTQTIGTPSITARKDYIAQSTRLGMTAFYKDAHIELRAAALHRNQNYSDHIYPLIYYDVDGIGSEYA